MIKEYFYNEQFYYKYFKNIDQNKYEIIIHYKVKPELNVLNNLKYNYTNEIISTKWGDLSLIKATLLLFKKANELNCDYFILISTDILPLINFNLLYEYITSKTHQFLK